MESRRSISFAGGIEDDAARAAIHAVLAQQTRRLALATGQVVNARHYGAPECIDDFDSVAARVVAGAHHGRIRISCATPRDRPDDATERIDLHARRRIEMRRIDVMNASEVLREVVGVVGVASHGLGSKSSACRGRGDTGIRSPSRPACVCAPAGRAGRRRLESCARSSWGGAYARPVRNRARTSRPHGPCCRSPGCRLPDAPWRGDRRGALGARARSSGSPAPSPKSTSPKTTGSASARVCSSRPKPSRTRPGGSCDRAGTGSRSVCVELAPDRGHRDRAPGLRRTALEGQQVVVVDARGSAGRVAESAAFRPHPGVPRRAARAACSETA